MVVDGQSWLAGTAARNRSMLAAHPTPATLSSGHTAQRSQSVWPGLGDDDALTLTHVRPNGISKLVTVWGRGFGTGWFCL